MTFWSNLYQRPNANVATAGDRFKERAPKGVDTEKYDRCVAKVKKAGTADSPYAVCGASLKKEGKTHGVDAPQWFWASAFDNPSPKPKNKTAPIQSGKPGYDQAMEIILRNPGISGPTLLNTLKAQGLEIVDTKPETGVKEADSASSNSPSLAAGVGAKNPLKKKKKAKQKESAIRETKSGNITFKTNSFFESVQRPDEPYGLLFKTVLLQEGLGNLSDKFYYTRNALDSAIPIFEGKKIYANHPSTFEDEVRPERDVRDVLGHFENVVVQESEDGRAQLVADLVILPEQSFDWARGLMKHSVGFAKKYPDKEFVGLSINASGDAEEVGLPDYMEKNKIPESIVPKLQKALDEGIDKVRVVNAIESAVSCDLVTEAGAGGKILKLIEEEKTMAKKAKSKESSKASDLKKLKEAEDEAKAKQNEDDETEGDDGEHDDAAKDKELIKSMLKKHVGDDADEEDEARAHEAYEAYKEMGYGEEESAEAAAKSMKLAKHMQAKQAEAEDEAESEDEGETESEGKQTEAEDESESEGKVEAKETDKKDAELLALRGRVAMLEARESGRELEGHIETLLKNSGLPRAATKSFREALGKKIKSKEEVNSKFKIFVEAYKAAGGEAGSYVISTEKAVDGGDRGVNFADCKID